MLAGVTVSGYSRNEEIAHTVTAGLGVAAMLVATPWLVVTASARGGAWRTVGAVAFGGGALLMFLTSALYHSVRSPGARATLRKLDHSAIYLLIAGTYTPFAIGVVGGSLGWVLFGIVWGLAALGVVAKMTGMLRRPYFSTVLYLVIGWIGLIAARPLYASLNAAQFAWLVAGGLCYTGGVPFYLWKRRAYAHAVWHLFVLAGVTCHFIVIASLLAAPAAL